MTNKEIEKLLKKKNILFVQPKYRVGDIVLYYEDFDPIKDSLLTVQQSKIIDAHALIDTQVKGDSVLWLYATEHTDEKLLDNLEDEDIICKL